MKKKNPPSFPQSNSPSFPQSLGGNPEGTSRDVSDDARLKISGMTSGVLDHGMVYLVGSGPGDPGLLTLKAKEVLEIADLIIYDYLANARHLRFAKKTARVIGVGKGFRHKLMSQDKINKLIVSEAKKSKIVVRLKGGDPYLFGRGGEEALLLQKNHIPFEVIPGVTSATACAGYAGIPLTHRDHNSSVTFLTGHKASDKDLDNIRWKNIVSVGGTLVIYMGFYNLAVICSKLMDNALSPKTPIAVIQWGTLPRQKSCVGTLSTIVSLVRKNKMGAPSIIIVGDVVKLHRRLGWYESLPLFSKSVLVTRSKDKAGSLASRLESLGASVIEMPTIEIKPVTNYKPMDALIAHLQDYHWLIFTSTYGVGAFFERLFGLGFDCRKIGKTKVAVVGSETASALRKYGLVADIVPKHFKATAIGDEFKKKFKNLKNIKIALLRADIAPAILEKKLVALGATIHGVTAYHTKMLKNENKALVKNLVDSPPDFVTFTSSSTFESFASILGSDNLKKVAKRSRFASIGPITSATIRNHGFSPSCQAKYSTIDGLVAVIRKNV